MRTNKPPNQLRIIAGRWRGRKLAFAPVPGLRPTPDRVREALFNWLSPVIAGARCLDLYAGSGALGLEAASRGAAEVVLVDSSASVAGTLRQELQRLDAGTTARPNQARALVLTPTRELAAQVAPSSRVRGPGSVKFSVQRAVDPLPAASV